LAITRLPGVWPPVDWKSASVSSCSEPSGPTRSASVVYTWPPGPNVVVFAVWPVTASPAMPATCKKTVPPVPVAESVTV